MANASPSSASTTTPTPSSAWSRLVQITRTASEGSRNKSNESSSQLNQIPSSGTDATSSVPPAKKRRLAESPPARSVTKYLAPLSPNLKDPRNMSPGKATTQITCPLISNHDCITACPCRVEDVDCVASQQQEHTKHCIPRSGRQLPSTAEDSNQDATPRKTRQDSRRGPSQRVRGSSPRPDEFKTTRDVTLTHFGELSASKDPVDETGTEQELASSASCASARLGNHDIVSRVVLETGQSAKDPNSFATGAGLQEGDQNSVNKPPISKRQSSSPASTDERIQLATPSSSPTAKPDIRANDAHVDATEPHKSAPVPKTKRRLTLHGSTYERQSSHKKRKAASKRKDGVQTTLSLAIGSSAGMRECKLCDTVYNPFHPEDVKVHAKRHACAVKRERRSDESSGLTASSLGD